jgi:hypothetical protein
VQKYIPSGSLGSSLLFIPLVTLPAIVVLSVVYSYISVYSPIIGVITFLVMLFFAYAVGTTISWAGFKAKCRNPMFLRLAGLAGGLAALFLSWVAFIFALLNRVAESADEKVSFLALLLNPLGLWEIILAINESGYYSISSTTPTGIVLWAIWGIEALAIVGITLVTATKSVEDNLFCEPCDQWCAVEGAVLTDEFEEVHTPERMHFETLLNADPVTNTDLPFVLTQVLACQRCGDTGGLKFGIVKTNNEGKQETEAVSGIYLADKESRGRLLAPPPEEAVAGTPDALALGTHPSG